MKAKMDKETAAIGAALVTGLAAAGKGSSAAGASITATISGIGAVVGGAAGGLIGSGIGLASAGIAMPATLPATAAGAAVGSWAGPLLALFGIGTAPAWAIPVAIGGVALTAGSLVAAGYKAQRVLANREEVDRRDEE